MVRLIDCIEEKEIEITYGLAQQVLENETMLLEASEACGELDRLVQALISSNTVRWPEL